MHGPELLFRAERGTARIDRVHQRIALIDRLDTPATEILDLERKDDEQPVDPTPDFFHARLLPCPDFRRDVVIGRYAALAAETGQTKVETGIVDQHEHVGSVGRHVALALLDLAEDRPQILQHFGKSHERRFLVVHRQILRSAYGGHLVAAPEAEAGSGIGLQYALHQVRPVQVARSLAGYQIVFHNDSVCINIYLPTPATLPHENRDAVFPAYVPFPRRAGPSFYRIPVRTRRNGFRPAPPSYGRACCPTAGCSRTSGRDSRPDVFNPPFESSGSPCESAPSGSQPWPSPDRLPSGLFPMPRQKSGSNPDTARYLNKSGRSRSVRSNACCSCHFSISAKLPDKSTSGTFQPRKSAGRV